MAYSISYTHTGVCSRLESRWAAGCQWGKGQVSADVSLTTSLVFFDNRCDGRTDTLLFFLILSQLEEVAVFTVRRAVAFAFCQPGGGKSLNQTAYLQSTALLIMVAQCCSTVKGQEALSCGMQECKEAYFSTLVLMSCPIPLQHRDAEICRRH